MKKSILLFLAALCLISMIGCTETDSPQIEIPDDALVMRNAEINDNYAVLPLCNVITGLGFELAWDGADRATFNCNGVEYVISLSEKSLTEAGDDENFLICPPGNDHYFCEVRDGILLLDDNTVHALFSSFIDYPIDISVNREDNIVIITKK